MVPGSKKPVLPQDRKVFRNPGLIRTVALAKIVVAAGVTFSRVGGVSTTTEGAFHIGHSMHFGSMS